MVLSSLFNVAFAGNPPEGFATLVDFVSGLEEMPTDEFVRVADLTPSYRVMDFYRALSEMDSKNFDRWNVKLRGIHTPGFVHNPSFWELHPKGPDLTIGFLPELRPQGFASITEFYDSLIHEDIGLFQKRIDLTPSEDLDRWMVILSKKNPNLYEDALAKAVLIRVVGFKHENEYRLIGEEVEEPGPLGFVESGRNAPEFPRIKSVKDLRSAFETSSPEELLSRLQALSSAQAGRLLNALKKSDPEFYALFIQKLGSRTKIGFTTSLEPELIAKQKPQKGPPVPIGFRAHREDCSQYLLPAKPENDSPSSL